MMEITVFRGQNIDVAILASAMQPSVWDLWWKITIYHDNWNNQLLIIGEAKTLKDFSTLHSRKQIVAYLEECNNFAGSSYLIVAVPWLLRITAQNYFIRMKQDKYFKIDKIVILDELGGSFEI